jgi:hypothetical protein
MVPRRRRPRTPRQINLRIDEPLRRRLEAEAKERQISTNQLMNQLLADGLENKAKQSLEDRVRRLENLVQRSDTPLPARVEAERRQREQEEGGSK